MYWRALISLHPLDDKLNSPQKNCRKMRNVVLERIPKWIHIMDFHGSVFQEFIDLAFFKSFVAWIFFISCSDTM